MSHQLHTSSFEGTVVWILWIRDNVCREEIICATRAAGRCALLPPRRRAHAAPAWDRGERPTQWWLTRPRPYQQRLGPASPGGPPSSWRSRQACQRGKPHSQGHSRSCVLRVVCAHSYASWVRREGAPVRPGSARGLFAGPVAGGEFVTPSAKTAPLGITLRAAKGRSSRCFQRTRRSPLGARHARRER